MTRKLTSALAALLLGLAMAAPAAAFNFDFNSFRYGGPHEGFKSRDKGKNYSFKRDRDGKKFHRFASKKHHRNYHHKDRDKDKPRGGSPVPEPGAIALFGVGLPLVAAVHRRRRS